MPKFDVPFIKQDADNECGAVALQMVLAYFGENYDKAVLAEKMKTLSSGMTYPMGIASAAASLGFPTRFYSKHLGFNPDHQDDPFYQEHAGDEDEQRKILRSIVQDCKTHNVELEERKLSLGEILSHISPDCIAIVLLNWNVMKGVEGYQGHIVPIVGYDEQKVYIHQQGIPSTQAFMEIPRDLFEQARTSEGTDEDILLIEGKK